MCDVTAINPVLVKEAEEYSGISDSKKAVEYILRLYFEKNNKKKILNFQNSNIWEGNLDEMRDCR